VSRIKKKNKKGRKTAGHLIAKKRQGGGERKKKKKKYLVRKKKKNNKPLVGMKRKDMCHRAKKKEKGRDSKGRGNWWRQNLLHQKKQAL